MKYSVFTVMLDSGMVPEEIVDNLVRLGYNGVEWRIHETYHISPVEISSRVNYFRHLTESRGLSVPSLATYLNSDEINKVREVLRASSMLGAGIVRVGIPRYDRTVPYHELFHDAIESLRQVEQACIEYGVRAACEIHFGTIAPSAALAKRLVERFDPQYIGVIFDPGNMIIEGVENWRMSLEILGEYLAHVHVKNSGWYPDNKGGWEWKWLPLKMGAVNWSQVIKDLKAVGYNGWLSFEDFSDLSVEDKLSGNIAYLKSCE